MKSYELFKEPVLIATDEDNLCMYQVGTLVYESGIKDAAIVLRDSPTDPVPDISKLTENDIMGLQQYLRFSVNSDWTVITQPIGISET